MSSVAELLELRRIKLRSNPTVISVPARATAAFPRGCVARSRHTASHGAALQLPAALGCLRGR